MPKKTLLLLCLMLSGMQAFPQTTTCEAPASPAIPSGRSATEKEMIETMEAVESFVATSIAYRECLEKEFSGIEGAKGQLPERARAVLEEAYQDSLEMDDLVANTFNTQLRIFKSLND